ncbi:alpha/beta hydrolase [Candidatus Saccharibacteria bacterium]|nr:alpha/beta hydrolase [Candidatus Saccharibacteria bacterium]
MLDKIIHKYIGIPYKIAVKVDKGRGRPIVFIHGIASDATVWDRVINYLGDTPRRILTLDLLGHGNSPKPDWTNYSAFDYAKSTARTLRSKNVKGAVLVGHSMGGLVCVEIAKQYPDLVSKLVLVCPPIYDTNTEGINKLDGRYIGLYELLVQKDDFTKSLAASIAKLMGEKIHFYLTPNSWGPIRKSLENTIIKQNTLGVLNKLRIPKIIIYGKYDPFIVSANYNKIKDADIRTTAAFHDISQSFSQTIGKILKEI